MLHTRKEFSSFYKKCIFQLRDNESAEILVTHDLKQHNRVLQGGDNVYSYLTESTCAEIFERRHIYLLNEKYFYRNLSTERIPSLYCVYTDVSRKSTLMGMCIPVAGHRQHVSKALAFFMITCQQKAGETHCLKTCKPVVGHQNIP